MNTYGGLFGFVIDIICDSVLTSNGIELPAGSKDDGYPKREDRAPYPPDDQAKPPLPVKHREAAKKRQAADKEFWENV